MKPIRVTDEWLYKYMPIVDEAIIRELENETDYDYKFSNNFNRRMKQLLWREAHPSLKTFSSIMKRVSIFIFCTFASLFLVTISVEAYRLKFFESMQTIWKDSILYTYFSDEDTEKLEIIVPNYIPTGYEEIERTVTDSQINIIYENELEQIITWDQILIQDGANLVIDSEYSSQIVKDINGYPAIISLYPDGYIGVYYEHRKYIFIITADSLSTEEIYSILQSIE